MGLIQGKVGINFHKGVRCFEANKAINHELEVHGYGGGEKEDEEEMVMVGVGVSDMK